MLPMNQLHAMCNMTNDEYLSLFVFMMGRPVSADKRILTDEVSITNELVLDSGCSLHMFNSCRNLTNFIAYAPNQTCVTVANGTSVLQRSVAVESDYTKKERKCERERR